MGGVDRRLNKWNEANIDSSFLDNGLDIMQGNTIMANVKYQAAIPLVKTPLIVMANRDVFPNEPRLNIRHIRYDWKTCPLLLDYRHRKPYPLAVAIMLLRSRQDIGLDYSFVNDIISKILT